MELSKTLRFILLFIFNFRSIIAQPEIDLTQTYGGNNWDEGHCVRETADGGYAAGSRSIQWDATDSMGRSVSAGVYLYHVNVGDFVQTRKMVLLK